MPGLMGWVATRLGSAAPSGVSAQTVRSLVVDANDGIIATAGIVEGFAGAGVTGTTLVIAALSAMIAGGVALGGVKYAEEAAERDAGLALIEEERRQLDLSPAEELDELVTLYEAKGLSPQLARQVADELTARDALAAHVDVEHGLSLEGLPSPLLVAILAGLAFAVGATVPLATVLVLPDDWRIGVMFVSVTVSLVGTSLILARAGARHVRRTLVRTLVVGASAMLITLGVGHLFHP